MRFTRYGDSTRKSDEHLVLPLCFRARDVRFGHCHWLRHATHVVVAGNSFTDTWGHGGGLLRLLPGYILTTTRLERRRKYAEEARSERSEYCVMCKANHAIAHLESLTDVAKKVRGTHLEIVEVIRADTFVLGIRPPEPRIIDSPCSDSDSSRASACQETLSCTAAFATALAGQ